MRVLLSGKPEAVQSDSEGYHDWTEEEIAQFMARHPLGTKAHLALMLMLCTGQRKSDAVRMGWGDVANGMIRVRQQKTGTPLMIPILPTLQAALADLPKDAPAFLLTEYGRPYSAAGFGNWMRDRCDEAGLPNCASHGLRKACARRLAEAGLHHSPNQGDHRPQDRRRSASLYGESRSSSARSQRVREAARHRQQPETC